jgi:hypothetical protein
VIGALGDHGVGGRFNFLLTDGEVIAATAAGDTLCYRLGGDSVVVASEPGDDEPGWAEVPARSVLVATPAGVDVRPLAKVPATKSPGALGHRGVPGHGVRGLAPGEAECPPGPTLPGMHHATTDTAGERMATS